MKMINKKINRFFICLFNLIMRTNLIKDFFLQQHNYNRCLQLLNTYFLTHSYFLNLLAQQNKQSGLLRSN